MTVLPCGHDAEQRDVDPAEGEYLDSCFTCGWQRPATFVDRLISSLEESEQVIQALRFQRDEALAMASDAIEAARESTTIARRAIALLKTARDRLKELEAR